MDKLAPTNTTASVSWGEFSQIYGGNANLQPYSARQGDVSLEWYFSEQSIIKKLNEDPKMLSKVIERVNPPPARHHSSGQSGNNIF